MLGHETYFDIYRSTVTHRIPNLQYRSRSVLTDSSIPYFYFSRSTLPLKVIPTLSCSSVWSMMIDLSLHPSLDGLPLRSLQVSILRCKWTTAFWILFTAFVFIPRNAAISPSLSFARFKITTRSLMYYLTAFGKPRKSHPLFINECASKLGAW
jgi:hypothetical protein